MRFLTTSEVARELGVSKRSVERWAKDGVIPCVRMKATVRIPETVISSGSLIGGGIIEQNTTDRAMLLRQFQTAAYFLEQATDIYDQRLCECLDSGVALDLIPPTLLDEITKTVRALRESLRTMAEGVSRAEPTDVRLRDCGQVSKFASGSVA